MKKNLESKVKDHIDSMLEMILDIKTDLRLHATPDIYGIKHIIKKGFNGSMKKLVMLESKRKALSILYPSYKYEERKIYLKDFIKTQPLDMDKNAVILFTALKVGAYIETFYYIKALEKELKSIYDKVK
jgi:hypothetical protein